MEVSRQLFLMFIVCAIPIKERTYKEHSRKGPDTGPSPIKWEPSGLPSDESECKVVVATKFKTFIPATEPRDGRRASEGFQKGSLKGVSEGF